ncbi:hypothetical protein ACIQLJ_04930 [Microbacterium sp. NPDC091313]
MRQYLFGTGLISAVTGGVTLLRGLRNHEPFTWRQGLAWASWVISLALAVGAVRDTRRARRGHTVPGDSPVSGKEKKAVAKRVRRR